MKEGLKDYLTTPVDTCRCMDMKNGMTIQISAKCSDMFCATLVNGEGYSMGQDYEGYVPRWMPGKHYGDYVVLNIDVETGVIKNWKRPSMEELEKTFEI